MNTGDPDRSPAPPLRVLRHSPQALRWVRQLRGWSASDLARVCGTTPSAISELETGSRNAGPAMMAKLAAALACPPVVLEAGQINQIATSPASALTMLDDLLSIADPAYAIHRDGIVQLGFLTDRRHIGTLHIREADLTELQAALRRHLPDQRSHPLGLARPKVKGTTHGNRDLIRRRASAMEPGHA